MLPAEAPDSDGQESLGYCPQIDPDGAGSQNLILDLSNIQNQTLQSIWDGFAGH
jgi:hypothetical protein